MKKYVIFILTCAISFFFSIVQMSAQSDSTAHKSLVLNYSILDLPFSMRAGKTVNSTIANPNADVSLIKGMSYFSMKQSLQLSANVTNSLGYGITKIPILKKKPVLKKVFENTLAAPVYFFARLLPHGPLGWIHEEWHRSVMVHSYTNSHNPFVFNPKEIPGVDGLHAVAFVLDTNLVSMKYNNNPNFVRMSSSGGESQIMLTESLQQQNFFNNAKLPITFLNLYNMGNLIGYMKICSNKEEITKSTLELLAVEGPNQEERDFTGYDYTAWAYDLFNPDVPYSARGLNPNGNGYDRYIYGDKLTDEQYKWIGKQTKLARINLLSPAMFFIPSITLKKYPNGDKLRGNFSGRYYPTPFGNSIGLDLMVSKGKYNIFVSPHLNQNYENSFPGIEAMLYEYPISYGQYKFLATPRIIVGTQPENLEFMTSEGQFFGLMSLDLIWEANKYLHPFLAIEGKTKGWMKGNVFLNDQISFEVGLSARFK